MTHGPLRRMGVALAVMGAAGTATLGIIGWMTADPRTSVILAPFLIIGLVGAVIWRAA